MYINIQKHIYIYMCVCVFILYIYIHIYIYIFFISTQAINSFLSSPERLGLTWAFVGCLALSGVTSFGQNGGGGGEGVFSLNPKPPRVSQESRRGPGGLKSSGLQA